MFEQVLVGMLGLDDSDEDRSAKLERAFKKLHDLTDGLHTALLKGRVFESLNAVVKDADVDSIDDELARAEASRESKRNAGDAASRTESTNRTGTLTDAPISQEATSSRRTSRVVKRAR